jgi:hypothetical protein
LRRGELVGTVFREFIGEFGRHDVSEAIGCGGR